MQEKIRNLIASNKIKEAIRLLQLITSKIDKEWYKVVINLSAQFEEYERNFIISGERTNERNKIIDGLTKIVEKIGNDSKIKEIDDLKEDAYDAEQIGDYHQALANIEIALELSDDEELKKRRAKLIEKILTTSPIPQPISEKFSFIWAFIITVLLASIIPLIIYKTVDEDISKKIHWAYYFNLILHIGVLICMILYKIKPKLDVDLFIKEADEFIREKFGNRLDSLKWFSERANETISQFGKWWKWLGISFLLLYLIYYFQICIDVIIGDSVIGKKLIDFADVIVNGSEAFFLFIVYRILTDDTIKPSLSREKIFEEDLNIQTELGVFVIALFLFICGVLFDSNDVIFLIVSRTISGAFVAICLSLIIGRLDTKLIDPRKWELWILYLYAAMQLLFTLFDKRLVESILETKGMTAQEMKKYDIDAYFDDVKTVVLYFMLILKSFFIYFIIKIHKKNELFYYLLLGSKLNDEVKRGKILSPAVVTEEKDSK